MVEDLSVPSQKHLFQGDVISRHKRLFEEFVFLKLSEIKPGYGLPILFQLDEVPQTAGIIHE